MGEDDYDELIVADHGAATPPAAGWVLPTALRGEHGGGDAGTPKDPDEGRLSLTEAHTQARDAVAVVTGDGTRLTKIHWPRRVAAALPPPRYYRLTGVANQATWWWTRERLLRGIEDTPYMLDGATVIRAEDADVTEDLLPVAITWRYVALSRDKTACCWLGEVTDSDGEIVDTLPVWIPKGLRPADSTQTSAAIEAADAAVEAARNAGGTEEDRLMTVVRKALTPPAGAVRSETEDGPDVEGGEA